MRKPGIEVLFDAASAGGQHNRRTVAECWLETEGRARAARRARSLTQQDAAESIGVSAEFYGRIERDERCRAFRRSSGSQRRSTSRQMPWSVAPDRKVSRRR